MILVTGGNGNIGQAICNELGKRGYEVISVGRRPLEPKLYKHVQCDITNLDSLHELFNTYKFDIVLHLAGLTNTNAKKNPDSAVEINIDGSKNLMMTAIEHNVPLVYGSSVNAIGIAIEGENGARESDMSTPQEFYGWTKRFVEEMGIALSNTKGLDFTSVRIPTIMGPGQGSVNTPWRETCFTQVGKGGELAITYLENSYIPACHIDDVVNAMCEILINNKDKKQKVYNLPAERIKVGELKRILEELDPNLKVSTGEVDPAGMCSFIDWSKFKQDFPIEIKTIKERLEAARDKNKE